MTDEEKEFRKRIIDLAEASERKNIPVFTDFLDLNEQNIFHCTEKQVSFIKTELFGGYENAERQMLAFIPDALSYVEIKYPISCLRISPVNLRFSEELTHRDYLGAILNTGIDRSRTGDILVDSSGAWLFCHEKLADFLIQELTRIKHTAVYCEQSQPENVTAGRAPEQISGTVASPRLDAVLSLALNVSRSSLTQLAPAGKVFINGRMITDNSYHPAKGDLISVRGYGRFRISDFGGTSKKGRQYIYLEHFI